MSHIQQCYIQVHEHIKQLQTMWPPISVTLQNYIWNISIYVTRFHVKQNTFPYHNSSVAKQKTMPPPKQQPASYMYNTVTYITAHWNLPVKHNRVTYITVQWWWQEHNHDNYNNKRLGCYIHNTITYITVLCDPPVLYIAQLHTWQFNDHDKDTTTTTTTSAATTNNKILFIYKTVMYVTRFHIKQSQ